MANFVVADGDVGHPAQRANVGTLVFGRENDGKAGLAKPTPHIFQNIVFEQHALCILQFKVILDNEETAVHPADCAGLARLPEQRLEQVVPADLNIGRCLSRPTPTKHDALAGGF